MTSPLKATALAAFTLVAGLGLWSLRSKPTPDLRRFGSPEEAASTLFTKARSSSASAAPARVASTPASRTVRGTVVDPDGRPIPGVALWRAAAPRPRAFMPFQRRERTFADGGWLRTDAAGRFAGELTADEPPPWLGARHADFLALQHLHPSSTEHDIEIRMTPLGRTQLEVEVIERPSGRRVPRYRLMASVQRPTGAEGGVASWSVLSRDELAFGAPLEVEFAVGLPLHLMVEVLGLGVGLDPDNVRREVTPVPGGTTHVRFELDLGAAERVAGVRAAFGRVLDDVTGEPLGGVEISAHPWRGADTVDGVTTSDYGLQDRRVQTFEDGRFVIALEGGGPAALLQAFHPHYRSAMVRFDGQSEAELRLLRRGALRGVVVGEQGQPLPNVPLLFLGEEDEFQQVTFERATSDDRRRTFTDDQGRFEFLNLDERRYHVFVLAGPRDPDERSLASASYALAEGEEREVVLEVDSPERVRVHGRVVPPVGVEHPLVPIFLPYDGELGWTPGQAIGGGYTAGGLARGRYLVLLAPANDDHGGPWALVPGVEIDAFGEQALDFAWPTGSLEGEVRLAGPSADLFITVRPELPAGFARDFLGAGEASGLLRVPLDAAGAFRVEHLAPGEHVLELSRGEHGAHGVLGRRRVTITGRTVLTPWQP